MKMIILLILTTILYGCNQVNVVTPLPIEQSAKGIFEIPKSLKNGTATYKNIQEWTSIIRLDTKLISKDLNNDNEKEYLAEYAYGRGATGNRMFMLFALQKQSKGYMYLGDISNLSSHITYLDTGNTYLITRWACGGGETMLGLDKYEKTRISNMGKLKLFIGDGGKEKDKILHNQIISKNINEKELIKLFNKK